MGQHSAVWQGYVDSSLMGSGQFDKAAIVSYDFSDVEASTPGYTFSPQELSGLKGAYDNPAGAFGTGVTLAGDKFVVIRSDGTSVYGKKGKEGVIIVKTPSAILVAHHGENVQTPNAATVVENLGDYIRGGK
ncbi:putative profilin [Aspergillus taichungensis]|uniref:Profilin n=1 Tax=Aspergillus taichungensis TaxID=482145 RepID=A0A2J5HQU5_9EURO|nr:putative profilin [Aspergillus taichungensis]